MWQHRMSHWCHFWCLLKCYGLSRLDTWRRKIVQERGQVVKLCWTGAGIGQKYNKIWYYCNKIKGIPVANTPCFMTWWIFGGSFWPRVISCKYTHEQLHIELMELLIRIKTPCTGVCCSDGGNNGIWGCSASKLLMCFYEEALERLHAHVSIENRKTASLFCCPQFSVARKEAERGWMRDRGHAVLFWAQKNAQGLAEEGDSLHCCSCSLGSYFKAASAILDASPSYVGSVDWALRPFSKQKGKALFGI